MDARPRQQTEIKIDITEVVDALNAVAAYTPNEFSGVGFGSWTKDGLTFIVTRIKILDIGTYAYTEIRPVDLKWALTDPELNKMKLWFHRHPMGRAEPGPANWSVTDNNTCRNEPLGVAFPPISGWTVSIVLTPTGWTGRVDEYGPGKGTRYVDVVPNFVDEWLPQLKAYENRAVRRYANDETLSEIGNGFRSRVPKNLPVDSEYEEDDNWDDIYKEIDDDDSDDGNGDDQDDRDDDLDDALGFGLMMGMNL